MSYSDSLTDSQWRSEAVRQYAADRGQFRPDLAWIISPFDTWEPNPCYIGPQQPHPEDDAPLVPLTFKQASAQAAALAAVSERIVTVRRVAGGFTVE